MNHRRFSLPTDSRWQPLADELLPRVVRSRLGYTRIGREPEKPFQSMTKLRVLFVGRDLRFGHKQFHERRYGQCRESEAA